MTDGSSHLFCHKHPGRIALGVCSKCGKGACERCHVNNNGIIFCRDCQPVIGSRNRLTGRVDGVVAAFLSLLVPGLGQVYNGQMGRGLVIFLTAWLILPWLFGVVDAYYQARKLSEDQKSMSTTSGYLVEALIIMLMVPLGPLMIFKASTLYFDWAEKFFMDSGTKNNLKTVSLAVEQYYQDHRAYPDMYTDLFYADPPYIDELYCDVEIGGYEYHCTFSKSGYLIKALPVDPEVTGSKTYMIGNGGALTTVIQEESQAPEDLE